MTFVRVLDALWRLAIVAALAWIGWGLQLLHQDLAPQPDDRTTAEAPAADPLEESIENLRDEVNLLVQKVDAVLVVMARAK
jgi:hypothetical protein